MVLSSNSDQFRALLVAYLQDVVLYFQPRRLALSSPFLMVSTLGSWSHNLRSGSLWNSIIDEILSPGLKHKDWDTLHWISFACLLVTGPLMPDRLKSMQSTTIPLYNLVDGLNSSVVADFVQILQQPCVQRFCHVQRTLNCDTGWARRAGILKGWH